MRRKIDFPKDLEYYLGLSYPVQMSGRSEDGEEYRFAEILDLPGCIADGETPDEAMENLEEAKRLWIESYLEDGLKVPEPSEPDRYSGKALVRMPRSLHRRLAINAKREGVSLNQLIVSQLAASGRIDEQLRDLRVAIERLSNQLVGAEKVAS